MRLYIYYIHTPNIYHLYTKLEYLLIFVFYIEERLRKTIPLENIHNNTNDLGYLL